MDVLEQSARDRKFACKEHRAGREEVRDECDVEADLLERVQRLERCKLLERCRLLSGAGAVGCVRMRGDGTGCVAAANMIAAGGTAGVGA